jgi:FkbM family methyltransferase
VVLDLGSTTGDFGILASRKVGPAGKIIAVEPNSNDYEILQENIRRNKCLNVTCLNIGAAGKRGIEVIKFRERHSHSKQRLWIIFSNPCLMLGTLIL